MGWRNHDNTTRVGLGTKTPPIGWDNDITSHRVGDNDKIIHRVRGPNASCPREQ